MTKPKTKKKMIKGIEIAIKKFDEIIKNTKLVELDEKISDKLVKLSQKYPTLCVQYLIEMHKILDWGVKELKKIK